MTTDNTKPRRWDPIVKLVHWGTVAAIIANGLFTGEGSGLHVWVGYGLAGLLALRLLWGFIGPAEARFSAFLPNPRRAIGHISEILRGEVTSHHSHNPLGALMVYAIWGCMAVIIGSGIAMSGPPPADPFQSVAYEEGEYSSAETYRGDREEDNDSRASSRSHEEDGEESEEEGEEMFEEIHEVAVNLLYILIALHIAGVMFESHRRGREIMGAMLPGGNRSSD